jgi:hypothetical protein
MAKIEGGCLCGSVRYTSDAEPKAVINCYCEACRKNSGSTNSFNLAMPAGSVKVTGKTVATYVDHSGASGKPFNRHFCSKCGSHFLSNGPAYEGLEFIKAGTLDNPNAFVPAVHIWCEEKLDWLELPKGSTQVPRNP